MPQLLQCYDEVRISKTFFLVKIGKLQKNITYPRHNFQFVLSEGITGNKLYILFHLKFKLFDIPTILFFSGMKCDEDCRGSFW